LEVNFFDWVSLLSSPLPPNAFLLSFCVFIMELELTVAGNGATVSPEPRSLLGSS
jgi:hypothetical protein